MILVLRKDKSNEEVSTPLQHIRHDITVVLKKDKSNEEVSTPLQQIRHDITVEL
jgi:hypothetical protein